MQHILRTGNAFMKTMDEFYPFVIFVVRLLSRVFIINMSRPVHILIYAREEYSRAQAVLRYS